MALNPRQLMKGHPTAPGPRDEYIPRHGRRDAADGTPGIPRVQPSPMSQGPGKPGTTPTGPLQPETVYDGPGGDDNSR